MIARVIGGAALAFISALFFVVPTVSVTYAPVQPRTGDTVTFTVVARSTTGAKQASPKLAYQFDAAWQQVSVAKGSVRAVVIGVDSGRMIATWQRSDGAAVSDTVWIRFASVPVVGGVSITPLSLYLLPKQQQQFTGLAWAVGASTPIVGAKLRWSLSDSTVGSLDSTGKFTALNAGVTNVRVEGGTGNGIKAGTAAVTVVPLTGGTKTDTVTLPGRVDTVYKTDPVLDSVLKNALVTPYRDTIATLRDSIARLLPHTGDFTGQGCPATSPGAIIVRLARIAPEGTRPDTTRGPIVICGPIDMAYRLMAHPEGSWISAAQTGVAPYAVIYSPPDTSQGPTVVNAGLIQGRDPYHWIVDVFSDTTALRRQSLQDLVINAVLASGVKLDSMALANSQVPIVETADTIPVDTVALGQGAIHNGPLPVWAVMGTDIARGVLAANYYARPARGTWARTQQNAWRTVCQPDNVVLYCSPGHTSTMSGNDWFAGWLDNIIPRTQTVLDLTLIMNSGYVQPTLTAP